MTEFSWAESGPMFPPSKTQGYRESNKKEDQHSHVLKDSSSPISPFTDGERLREDKWVARMGPHVLLVLEPGPGPMSVVEVRPWIQTGLNHGLTVCPSACRTMWVTTPTTSQEQELLHPPLMVLCSLWAQLRVTLHTPPPLTPSHERCQDPPGTAAVVHAQGDTYNIHVESFKTRFWKWRESQ